MISSHLAYDGSQATLKESDGLAAKESVHKTVNHREEYVRGRVSTQAIENFGATVHKTPFHYSELMVATFRFLSESGAPLLSRL